jgi:hypothetical protein
MEFYFKKSCYLQEEKGTGEKGNEKLKKKEANLFVCYSLY